MSDMKKLLAEIGRFGGSANKISAKVIDLSRRAGFACWEHNDPSAVNKLISVLPNLKGVTQARLINYYKECIPHAFDSDNMTFGKRINKKKEAMQDMYEDFLNTREWHEFKKEASTAAYKLPDLAKQVQDKIKKAHEAGTLTLEQLQDAKKALNDMMVAEINAFNKVNEYSPEDVITPETKAA